MPETTIRFCGHKESGRTCWSAPGHEGDHKLSLTLEDLTVSGGLLLTGEFKENAESLNTADSVQVDVNAPTPDEELEPFLVRRELPSFDLSTPMTAAALAEAQGFVDGDLPTGLDGQAVLDLVGGRLLAEVESRGRAIEALSARLTAKNAELDKVIREAAADKAKLATKVADLEAQVEAGRRVEKGEPCPECGGTVSPWRDVRGKVGFHACTTCTWPLPGPDGKWRTASGMPHPPAQEATDER